MRCKWWDCEDLTVADFNNDWRLDAAASRATKNVKIYFNEEEVILKYHHADPVTRNSKLFSSDPFPVPQNHIFVLIHNTLYGSVDSVGDPFPESSLPRLAVF